jgi:hypothetical protein
METRLQMRKRNQVILANVVLMAAILFDLLVAHSSTNVVIGGVFLLLLVNVIFLVTWIRKH